MVHVLLRMLLIAGCTLPSAWAHGEPVVAATVTAPAQEPTAVAAQLRERYQRLLVVDPALQELIALQETTLARLAPLASTDAERADLLLSEATLHVDAALRAEYLANSYEEIRLAIQSPEVQQESTIQKQQALTLANTWWARALTLLQQVDLLLGQTPPGPPAPTVPPPPQLLRALILQAKIHDRKGESDQARRLDQRIARLAPGSDQSIEAGFRLGLQEIKAGRCPAGRAWLEPVARPLLAPEQPHPSQTLSSAAGRRGQLWSLYWIAECHDREQQPALARQLLELLIKQLLPPERSKDLPNLVWNTKNLFIRLLAMPALPFEDAHAQLVEVWGAGIARTLLPELAEEMQLRGQHEQALAAFTRLAEKDSDPFSRTNHRWQQVIELLALSRRPEALAQVGARLEELDAAEAQSGLARNLQADQLTRARRAARTALGTLIRGELEGLSAHPAKALVYGQRVAPLIVRYARLFPDDSKRWPMLNALGDLLFEQDCYREAADVFENLLLHSADPALTRHAGIGVIHSLFQLLERDAAPPRSCPIPLEQKPGAPIAPLPPRTELCQRLVRHGTRYLSAIREDRDLVLRELALGWFCLKEEEQGLGALFTVVAAGGELSCGAAKEMIAYWADRHDWQAVADLTRLFLGQPELCAGEPATRRQFFADHCSAADQQAHLQAPDAPLTAQDPALASQLEAFGVADPGCPQAVRALADASKIHWNLGALQQARRVLELLDRLHPASDEATSGRALLAHVCAGLADFECAAQAFAQAGQREAECDKRVALLRQAALMNQAAGTPQPLWPLRQPPHVCNNHRLMLEVLLELGREQHGQAHLAEAEQLFKEYRARAAAMKDADRRLLADFYLESINIRRGDRAGDSLQELLAALQSRANPSQELFEAATRAAADWVAALAHQQEPVLQRLRQRIDAAEVGLLRRGLDRLEHWVLKAALAHPVHGAEACSKAVDVLDNFRGVVQQLLREQQISAEEAATLEKMIARKKQKLIDAALALDAPPSIWRRRLVGQREVEEAEAIRQLLAPQFEQWGQTPTWIGVPPSPDPGGSLGER